MLATRLAKQEEQSIRRTHSALIPAYLMRDDGSVFRIWPSGHIERIGAQPGKCDCRRAEYEKPGTGDKRLSG